MPLGDRDADVGDVVVVEARSTGRASSRAPRCRCARPRRAGGSGAGAASTTSSGSHSSGRSRIAIAICSSSAAESSGVGGMSSRVAAASSCGGVSTSVPVDLGQRRFGVARVTITCSVYRLVPSPGSPDDRECPVSRWTSERAMRDQARARELALDAHEQRGRAATAASCPRGACTSARDAARAGTGAARCGCPVSSSAGSSVELERRHRGRPRGRLAEDLLVDRARARRSRARALRTPMRGAAVAGCVDERDVDARLQRVLEDPVRRAEDARRAHARAPSALRARAREIARAELAGAARVAGPTRAGA